jgi:2-dehydro-3-deoxygluconokinase
MSSLCEYIDYCIANEEDAKDVFGIEADNTDIYSGKLDRNGYISVAKKLTDRFNFKGVAITLRESKSADINFWAASLNNGKDFIVSKKYEMYDIIDRVGGGDSFAGGLIYGLNELGSDKEALEFAVAASCLKHTIEGDFNRVTIDEVLKLANGDGSGRVQR